MGFPKVTKFLCCLELETGGVICGWFTAVLAIIGIISLGVTIILSIVHSGTFDEGHHDADHNSVFQGNMIVAIVVLVIHILYCCILLYAAVQLVIGQNKNHGQMKLYLILMAIGVILPLLQIIMMGPNGIASAIIHAVISAYAFICIYSLYKKVKGGDTSAVY